MFIVQIKLGKMEKNFDETISKSLFFSFFKMVGKFEVEQ